MDDSRRRGILIFGGARGIGGATAELFADRGWNVAIADVLDDDGARLANRLEEQGHFTRCDVALPSDIERAFNEAATAFPSLNAVFNNVGIARYGTVDELSLEDWEATFRVNVTAQFISAGHAVRLFRQQGGGVIVNTASILGHASQKTTAAYAASKAAVMGLTRTIAIDHAKDGIRCVSISPGTIDTPLVQIAADQFDGRSADEMRLEWAAAHPVNRLGSPAEVAATVFFLASPEAGFITGSDILIDGGIRSELYA
jgi:NAD(P)-dependent dehydrogenase (short-subunit alcohol dehydrogenase family)